MNNNFVTYNISLKLKELGFNKVCLGLYLDDPNEGMGIEQGHFYYHKPIDEIPASRKFINAPLWQEAFDWFLTAHNLTWEYQYNDSQIQIYVGEVTYPDNSLEFVNSIQVEYNGYAKALNIAKLQALEQMISLVENKIKYHEK